MAGNQTFRKRPFIYLPAHCPDEDDMIVHIRDMLRTDTIIIK